MLVKLNIEEYCAKLASKDPAPGGGSAAAVSGLLGTSLLEMVINLSIGRPDFAAHDDFLAARQSELALQHQELLLLTDLDATAFSSVIAAYKLPKTTPEETKSRSIAIQAAVLNAAEIPLRTARACLKSLEIGKSLSGKINPHAVSDLVVGSLACHAGIVSALLNTAINIPLLKDEKIAAELTGQIGQLQASADDIVAAIKTQAYSEPPFDVMK